MEFKVSFNWKKKALETPAPPIITDGKNFYPTSLIGKVQNNQVLIDMYNELPEVNAPVNYYIDTMPNIPFDHYRNDEVIADSKVMGSFKKPNQYQTKADYIKLWFLNRVVLGSSYSNRVKAIGANKVQLYVLPTKTTLPILKEDNSKDIRTNQILGYTTDFGKGKIRLEKEEVFSQIESNFNDDNYYNGWSRLMSVIMSSKTLRANYEARVNFYENRGALGIIAPKNEQYTLTPDDKKKLNQEYQKTSGITKGKLPFMMNGIPVDYTQLGYNVAELQLNESQERDFKTICNALLIDPALFGVGNNTYNNKILAETNYWQKVAMPNFNSFLELHDEIFELPENEELKADYTNIPSLQTDWEKKVNGSSKQWNDGTITKNEYRTSTGWGETEDGEKTKIELSAEDNVNQE
jgi:phage portal protein BeeE